MRIYLELLFLVLSIIFTLIQNIFNIFWIKTSLFYTEFHAPALWQHARSICRGIIITEQAVLLFMYASDLLLCAENHVWFIAVSGFPEDELRLDAQSVSRSVGEERGDSSIMQRLRKEKNAVRTGILESRQNSGAWQLKAVSLIIQMKPNQEILKMAE